MKLRRKLIFAAAVVSLASCSSSKTATPSTTGSSTPSAQGTSAAQGTSVPVTETEFSITLAPKTLSAGTYTFKVANNGKFTHNLTVDGPGVADKATPALSPGDSGDVTVTLQKGSYTLYCSVDSHKDKGMDVTVQVT